MSTISHLPGFSLADYLAGSNFLIGAVAAGKGQGTKGIKKELMASKSFEEADFEDFSLGGVVQHKLAHDFIFNKMYGPDIAVK